LLFTGLINEIDEIIISLCTNVPLDVLLVEALFLLMRAPDEVIGPMNLGNPEECTILELAKQPQ